MGASNIGMMDSAYFVGRNEILAWVNSTLHLALSKVEEVGRPSTLNAFDGFSRVFLSRGLLDKAGLSLKTEVLRL
jgi:hypothetical protein